MGLPSCEQWGVRDAVEGRDESGRVLLLSCVVGRLSENVTWKRSLEEVRELVGKMSRERLPGKTYHGGGSAEMALPKAGVGPGDGRLESGTAAEWIGRRGQRGGAGVHVQSAVLAAIRRLASTVSVIGSLWSERQLFGWPSADQAFYKLLLWISDRSIASRLANSYLQSGCISVRMN